jgi:dolichol kinase
VSVGDGLSDIIGRKWGKVKWPFSQNKSIIGSLAFAVGAFGATLGMMYFVCSMGYPGVLGARAAEGFTKDLVLRVLGISLACAAVEILPATAIDDNISVPVAAAVLAKAILQ